MSIYICTPNLYLNLWIQSQQDGLMLIYLAKFGILRLLVSFKDNISKYYPETSRLLVQSYSVMSRHREGMYNDNKAIKDSIHYVEEADEFLKHQRPDLDVVILKHGDLSMYEKKGVTSENALKAENLYDQECANLIQPFQRSVAISVPQASAFLPQLNQEVVVEVIKAVVEDVASVNVEGRKRLSVNEFKEKVIKGADNGVLYRNRRAGVEI
jgi:hypothetical protein